MTHEISFWITAFRHAFAGRQGLRKGADYTRKANIKQEKTPAT